MRTSHSVPKMRNLFSKQLGQDLIRSYVLTEYVSSGVSILIAAAKACIA